MQSTDREAGPDDSVYASPSIFTAKMSGLTFYRVLYLHTRLSKYAFIGLSPFILLYNQHPKLPVEVMLEETEDDTTTEEKIVVMEMRLTAWDLP